MRTPRTAIDAVALALGVVGAANATDATVAGGDWRLAGAVAASAAPMHTADVVVTGISDGDTATAQIGGKSVRLRLARIDAPEHRQPWGNRSEQSLRELVWKKQVRIEWRDVDRNARPIVTMTVDGKDVSEEQVRRGMAWVYRAYSRDPRLLELEAQAREARIGLWADPAPVAPWVWRREARDRGHVTDLATGIRTGVSFSGQCSLDRLEIQKSSSCLEVRLMGLATPRMTLAEFMAWEADQPQRHEFFRGEVFAMVGGSARHNRVILNLAGRIGDHVDGTNCQVFAGTMKVQLADEGVLYPDVMVTCGKAGADDETAITDPELVIEVLSPVTSGYDKRDKFILYRSLPSLREYAVVDPAKRQVEVFTWTETGACLLTDQTSADVLTLSSIELKLPMALVFKGVEREGA